MNLNPLLQPSHSIGLVLLLAACKADTLPGVRLLQAAGVEARASSLVAAIEGKLTDLAGTAAVVWFFQPEAAGDRADSPERVLPRWRAAGYEGALILVTDRLDPNLLAACFRAGLTDYLETSDLERLPQVLQRATSVLSTPPATARQALEARVRQLEREKQELIANERVRDEFFATMSHELRAPLANILGFAKMLRDRVYGPLNARQYQYASSLYNCGEYLLELINDLLDLAKIEADREELNWETVGIAEVCQASLDIVSSRAIGRGLQLQLHIDPNLKVCKVDRLRLQQILINLLSNAVKFTDAGSVRLQVAQHEDEIRFSVIDTGIGISGEDLENLFEPFRQIRLNSPPVEDRSERGTGLGLALSRKLARLHGGDLTATSEPDRGSCFTFHLPINAPDCHDSEPDSGTHPNR